MKTSKIELRDNVVEYHPKDKVEGKVICTFDDVIHLQSVEVRLIGEERTKFLKIRNDEIATHNVRTEMSEGYNIFLSLKENFVLNKILEPEASHGFEFSFLLPEDIPSSYQCSKGWVKFFIEAILLEANGNKSEHLEEIHVLSPVRIPQFAWFDNTISCQEPYNQSIEKSFPSFCCTGDSAIVADIYLPRRSLLQGARLPIQIDVSNTTDEKIQRIEVVLGQTIQMKGASEDGYRFKNETLVSVSKSAVDKDTAMYEFALEVPKTPVLPNFTRCKLFVQKCWLDVKVILRHDYLKVTTWVFIGQITDEENDFTDDRNRLLSRSNSRDQVGSRSSRSLLLYKGPAPYSSFKQRPAGFAMAQPITSQVRNVNMPLPPDSTTHNNSTAYPPTAGPSLSLPDVPQESPPSYEEAVSNESPRRRSAVSVADIAPSAPVAAPDTVQSTTFSFASPAISIAPYPPMMSPVGRRNVPQGGVPNSTPYPIDRNLPSLDIGVGVSTPYPLSPPASTSGRLFSDTVGVSKIAPYPPVSPPLIDRNLPSSEGEGASSAPYPITSPTRQSLLSSISAPYPLSPRTSTDGRLFSDTVGVSNTAPYPTVSPPLRNRNLPSWEEEVNSSARYPLTDPFLVSDSIGFGTFSGPSSASNMPTMSMPMPRITPYPIEKPTGMPAASFTSMPLPPSHFGQHAGSFGYPEMVNSDDPLSKWDLVRAAVPDMVANNQMPSPTLYPPVRPPPRVDSITPVAMPMPSSDLYAPSPTDNSVDLRNSVPYPVNVPLLVSGSIGFAVLDNAAPSNGGLSVPRTRPNT